MKTSVLAVLCVMGGAALLLWTGGCGRDDSPAPKPAVTSSVAMGSAQNPASADLAPPATSPSDPIGKLELPDAEWRKRLTPEQYHILREHGTEQAFTGPYWDWHGDKGTFHCAGCDLPLFEANTKFDSGTGWPSFYDCVPGHVLVSKDTSFGMVRDELSCARCGGHLGHVFEDGPKPTGKRYCIDGYALKLTGEK